MSPYRFGNESRNSNPMPAEIFAKYIWTICEWLTYKEIVINVCNLFSETLSTNSHKNTVDWFCATST
jgi:hypothetical protein